VLLLDVEQLPPVNFDVVKHCQHIILLEPACDTFTATNEENASNKAPYVTKNTLVEKLNTLNLAQFDKGTLTLLSKNNVWVKRTKIDVASDKNVMFQLDASGCCVVAIRKYKTVSETSVLGKPQKTDASLLTKRDVRKGMQFYTWFVMRVLGEMKDDSCVNKQQVIAKYAHLCSRSTVYTWLKQLIDCRQKPVVQQCFQL